MSDLIYGVGRVLIALIFIVSGVNHFLGAQGFADSIAAANFPLPAQIEQYLPIAKNLALAYLVAGIEVIGGVLIFAGWLTRLAAAVLFVFCALTIYFVHHFWDMEAAARTGHQLQALKNLAIMGGLLLLGGRGAGAVSLDRIATRSAKGSTAASAPALPEQAKA
jgi:putative oxidoreductase